MRKINPWMIVSVVLVLAIAGILFGKQITGFFITNTSQDISDKVMKYINENLVSPNTTANLVSIDEFKGLYNVSISYQDKNLTVFVTKDGNYVFLSQPLNMNEKVQQQEIPQQTIGNFFILNSEICKENEKPIVYFFGSERCEHCMWESPVIRNVTNLFSGQIVFHENIDTEADKEIFLKYSPKGYIPTIIIGCKYFRVGSGASFGELNEAKNLAAFICSVTNNRPLAVCATVEDLINQIG